MGFDVLKEFGTDADKESTGVWNDLDANPDENLRAKVLVARATNPQFTNYIRTQFDKFSRMLERKDAAADAKSDEIMIAGMSMFILKDWQNFTDNGQPLPYSVLNARKLLQVRDFRELIMGMSRDVASYRKEVIEEVKNA